MRSCGLRPSYQVVSTLLLALTMLGLGFRVIGRFLPEAQPNRVATEYSTFLRVVGRQKIDWYPYSAEAFARAKSLDRLIYLEVGSLFSRRSNTVSERFYTEEEFARLLHSHFISIRVDMLELPGVALALANNSPAFVELEGVIFAVLTPEGYPIRLTGYRQIRRSTEPLGMYEWLSEIARDWVQSRDRVRDEAHSRFDEQQKLAAELISVGPVSFDLATSFAAQVAKSFDSQSGRIGDFQAPLAPPCLAMLLSLKPTFEDGRRWARAVRFSATYDHAHGGLFEESIGGWWTPAYGKRAGRSAQYAALFSAVSQDDELMALAARQTVEWLSNSIVLPDGPLFGAGMASDELVFDGSRYYDVSSTDLPTGSPFRIVDNRSVGPLFLAESQWTARPEIVARATKKLSELSSTRQKPMFDTSAFTDDNARVVSGLAETGVLLGDDEIIEMAVRKFSWLANDRVFGLGDVEHAPSGRAKTTGFSGDYVWIARAAIDVYRATGNSAYLDIAKRVTIRTHELFADSDGLLIARLKSERVAAFEMDVRPVADDYHESINAVWIRNLQDLSAILGDAERRNLALRALQSVSGAVQKLGIRGAGIVRAMLEHFRPTILVAASDPLPFARELQRRHPGHFVSPSPDENAERGYYWVESGIKQGPLTLAEIEARIRLSVFR
jgi:uncharacterized protein YyaL (SSP411 family)